ncbi:hypothetical protein ZIOFF_007909 [Zingiber officinale]|uniref:Uncharacterized protein n=1 Tax=Zingiber officinale TaxID=94328 RepID=A0A8J5M664_ZINOF|nr:hypothetical protein ZIOFF_007909 [Zingiber officinale]
MRTEDAAASVAHAVAVVIALLMVTVALDCLVTSAYLSADGRSSLHVVPLTHDAVENHPVVVLGLPCFVLAVACFLKDRTLVVTSRPGRKAITHDKVARSNITPNLTRPDLDCDLAKGIASTMLTQYNIEEVQDHCNYVCTVFNLRSCPATRLLKMIDGLNFKDFATFLSAFRPQAEVTRPDLHSYCDC